MSETKLERALGEYAKGKGCYWRKYSSPGQRGVPDRICACPGNQILFLELKAPGKKPSALQNRELRILREMDINATWTDNLEEGKKLIDALCS